MSDTNNTASSIGFTTPYQYPTTTPISQTFPIPASPSIAPTMRVWTDADQFRHELISAALDEATKGDGISSNPNDYPLRMALTDFVARLQSEVDRLTAALREIAKGEGAFSRDPLTHAENVIADMQKLALAALSSPITEPK